MKKTEANESKILIENTFAVARALNCKKILVYANHRIDVHRVKAQQQEEKIIWVTSNDEVEELVSPGKDHLVTIPDIASNRMSKIRVAILQAIIHGYIQLEETIVCLTGLAGSTHLDNLLITNAKRDFPWFRENKEKTLPALVKSKVFVRLLDIALRLAIEGREGKPIGTTLVLGSKIELADKVRQLILNPCKGHSEQERSIFNQGILESIREFSAMDGAIVVNRRGLIHSAGTYLDTPTTKAQRMTSGLGSRHISAFALTLYTNALSIVISESSGKVTVFYQGKTIITLDKM